MPLKTAINQSGKSKMASDERKAPPLPSASSAFEIDFAHQYALSVDKSDLP